MSYKLEIQVMGGGGGGGGGTEREHWPVMD